jgi:hypothetical protein
MTTATDFRLRIDPVVKRVMDTHPYRRQHGALAHGQRPTSAWFPGNPVGKSVANLDPDYREDQ